MKQKISIIILIFTINLLMANVSLPNFFSDNMVLQRNAKIPVWGFANPNEKVSVQFKNQTKSTIADQNGDWKITLDEENFGGPFELKISGENQIILKNILIGDVWLCSGQSNMEWTVGQSFGYEDELKQTNFPPIRHIKFQHEINTSPQKNILKTEWKVADASTIGEFSGVAYYFAKKLYQETKIPIGLLGINWGGTNVETWIPRDAFENSPYFKEMISKMPKISLDSLVQVSKQNKIQLIEKKLGSKISNFNQTQFLNNDFNDENLPEIKQPLIWENQGFEDLDGIIWLRKTIFLKEEDLQNDAKIYLGKIDDKDETYFNGVKIGENSLYDADRIYTIPKNILKFGKNVISVKVIDTGGGGGIWGGEENVKLITSKNIISLAGKWKFRVAEMLNNVNENSYPSLVYNAMIAPVVPFAIKGFIWYQGESNSDRATEYNKSFPLLINSWREKFGKDLPFYFVQLATFAAQGNSNNGCEWCELREAQTNTLKLKNTGMVVTTDVGDKDIHPKNKKTVGGRLANLALNNGIVSPIFKDYKISGSQIFVEFTPNLKLKTSDKSANLKCFEIAGNDQNFYPASAKLLKNRVVVSSEKVKKPVAVRFGWKGDDSECNLVTEDNLPVSPFRTDDFKTLTKDKKYEISFQR